LKSIQSRIDKIIGHKSLLKTIIKGDVEGHIGRGSPRTECITQIMKDTNKRNYKDLKELSYNIEAGIAATN